jgi:hypothetical protein
MHTSLSVPMDLDKKKKEPFYKAPSCEFQIPKAKQKKLKNVHLGEECNSEGSQSDEDQKKHYKDSLDCSSKIELKNFVQSKKILKKKTNDIIGNDTPLSEGDISNQEEYLKSHPNDYNCLTKLLELYKHFNHKKKLKELRVYMLKIYPLSEGILLLYILRDVA